MTLETRTRRMNLRRRRARPRLATHDRRDRRTRHGMTLLELMLALTLSAIVLVAISTAVDLHLRVLQTRRDHLEHIQVARGVLELVAADLRATVQQNTTDFSGLESLAAGMADGDFDASGGGGESAGPPRGSSGGGGRDSSGRDSDSAGASGAPRPGGSGSTPPPPGDGPALDIGARSSGRSAASSFSAAGGTRTPESAGGDATTSIVSATSIPPVPGLYGTQYELQLDVSRLPRVDQYERMLAAEPLAGLQDVPSDVKTVAYYCVDANSVTAAGVINRRTGQPETGLVRRVLDRAVTLQAAQSGNTQGLAQAAQVVAPEVRQIEFQYFDGLQWLTAWDSCQQQRLPVAVQITVYVTSRSPLETERTGPASPTLATPLTNENVYSLVVHLPTALPVEQDGTTTVDRSGLDAVGL